MTLIFHDTIEESMCIFLFLVDGIAPLYCLEILDREEVSSLVHELNFRYETTSLNYSR